MAVARDAQGHRRAHAPEPAKKRSILAEVGSLRSPGTDNHPAISRVNWSDGLVHGFDHPFVIIRPDRIEGLTHVSRIGRPDGEQIRDNQPSEPPSADEADSTANGRVVAHGICRGWVQHDEGRSLTSRRHLTS